MICTKCPYSGFCDNGFTGEKLEECKDYQEFEHLQEEWYEEEMNFLKNMQQLYTFDENGFCDGFPT